MRKPSYLLNDYRNFNDIFRKDMTYDNTESLKKSGVHPLFTRYIFGKTTGRGVKLTPFPSFFRVKY